MEIAFKPRRNLKFGAETLPLLFCAVLEEIDDYDSKELELK